MSSKIESKVEKIIEKNVLDLGYELENVEYLKEGDKNILRVTIDSKDGVGIDDCEKVSREVDEIIEQSNIIKSEYVFEVSSPGVERYIKREKHYDKYKNYEVFVKLYKQINGKKEIQGILKGLNEENIVSIDINGKEIQIPKANVAVIRTVYNWDNK